MENIPLIGTEMSTPNIAFKFAPFGRWDAPRAARPLSQTLGFSMAEYLTASLILLPVILAVLSAAICWRSITHRALFFIATTLSLLGIQSLAAPVATAFVITADAGLSATAGYPAFSQAVLAAAGVQLLVGLPFVWWLYRAFRKP